MVYCEKHVRFVNFGDFRQHRSIDFFQLFGVSGRNARMRTKSVVFLLFVGSIDVVRPFMGFEKLENSVSKRFQVIFRPLKLISLRFGTSSQHMYQTVMVPSYNGLDRYLGVPARILYIPGHSESCPDTPGHSWIT
jgi:hypothetical protein